MQNKNITKEAWAKKHGLKEAITPAEKRRVAKKLGFKFSATKDCNDDHLSFWLQNGKPWGMVSQPYHLDTIHIESIVARVIRHNLQVRISTEPSWHNVGHVLFITYQVGEV